MTTTTGQYKALREPFPPEVIGKIPKGGEWLDYSWSRKKGSRVPASLRFWMKVAADPGGCLIWNGARNSKGYGTFRTESGTASAHRWSWESVNGPVPDGLELDHLCFVRNCVNPQHLEPVTHAENVRRGRVNQNDGKSTCVRGHAFDAENTRTDSRGNRSCRSCGRLRTAEYRARKAADK